MPGIYSNPIYIYIFHLCRTNVFVYQTYLVLSASTPLGPRDSDENNG